MYEQRPYTYRMAIVLAVCMVGVALWWLGWASARFLDTDAVLAPDAVTLRDDDLGSDLKELSPEGMHEVTTVAEDVAKDKPDRSDSAQLNTVVIGSVDNPFSNTCNGKAIGFVGPTGERPKMEFTNVPQGAVLQCRSGRDAELSTLPFRPCDGENGVKPYHTPELAAEGKYRTEVKSILGGTPSSTKQVTYYVHHSLDQVACCEATHPDTAWFEAARSSIQPTVAFDDKTSLDNPFIKIVARTASSDQSENFLSLRRTFRLSADNKLLLIRRTMASRRTFEDSKSKSCVGLSISVPIYGIDPRDVPSCSNERESKFRGGLVAPHCPDIYCTVSSCRSTASGCIQVTHTFNRGPGQQPWVVQEPAQCADQRRLKFEDFHCDTYVLNGAGDAVCLVNDQGTIRASKAIVGSGAPLGLTLLAVQRGGPGSDRYVFSAKTDRRPGIKNMLYLPH